MKIDLLDEQFSFSLILAYFSGLPYNLYRFSDIDLSVVGKQWLHNGWHIDCVADMSRFESCLNH